MRITREIIAPGHRWRAIDNKRMKKICKDVKKIISDFLGPQISRTQASIRKYIDRECNQCSVFACLDERAICTRCPQEICAFCYELPKVNIRQHPDRRYEDWDMLCRPCHKESCKIDRNSWDLIKSFMFVKCDCCSKLMPGAARCGYHPLNRIKGTWFKCDGCKKNLCKMKNGASYSVEGPIHCLPCIDKKPMCQYCLRKSHHKTFQCPECKSMFHDNCVFTGIARMPGEDKCVTCLEDENPVLSGN